MVTVLLSLIIIALLYFPIRFISSHIRANQIVIYLLVGILFSPHLFGLIPEGVIDGEVTEVIFILTLTFTLAEGAFELDLSAIGKHKRLSIGLSFLPVMMESMVVAFTTYFLLNDDPNRLWYALCIGFLTGPVSPAIVVPYLTKLIKKNARRDIYSIQLLGASLDDLLGVFAYYGIVIIIFGAQINLVLSFITLLIMPAALLYRRARKHKVEKEEHVVTWIRRLFATMMFIVLGALLNFSELTMDSVMIAIAVLLVFPIGKTMGILLAFAGKNIDWKDVRFCMLANIPKATVQASLGGLAMALNIGSEQFQQTTLAVSILLILVTAPVGSIVLNSYTTKRCGE